jgi:hypothetical protein
MLCNVTIKLNIYVANVAMKALVLVALLLHMLLGE